MSISWMLGRRTKMDRMASLLISLGLAALAVGAVGCGLGDADREAFRSDAGSFDERGGSNNGSRTDAGGYDRGGPNGGYGADASGAARADAGGGGQEDDSDEDSETWKRSEIVPHATQVKVGDDKKLDFSGLQAHVRIDGFRARVLLDYYFHNPDSRQYEGTFKVRLPDGGSPYYLAFGASEVETEPNPSPEYEDSEKVRERGFSPKAVRSAREDQWVDPKEAKIVPKDRASRAYKQEVQQQVDPALAEWAGPGIFNARLFPIQPNKLHRVVFGYEVNLTRLDETLNYRFPVPKGVPSSAVDIEVTPNPNASVDFETPESAEADTSPKHGRFDFDSPEENKLIEVDIEDPGTTALTGSDPDVGEFFTTRFEPDVEKTKADRPTKRAIFAVDVSMSSNPDRFNIWRKLMRATLENNRGELEEFAVVFFNVETFWWKTQFTANTEDNVESLMSYIDSLALEGASDLGAALREASSPEWSPVKAPYDVFLLSDGNATWGQEDNFALSKAFNDGGGRHLFAYRTGISGDDTTVLRHLARETHGAVFSVVGEDEIEPASKAHAYRPWVLDDVVLPETSDLLLAGRPNTYFPGQQLVLAGRGSVETGDVISLKLRRGDQTRTVETTIDHASKSKLAARAYGYLAVEQLEQFLGSTRKFAEAYSRQFRVARKSSSLLMLESKEDYRRYGIEPQEDARLVRQNQVEKVLADAIAELRDSLGEAKQSFLDWVDDLKETPGVDLSPSETFLTFLEGLPEEAYEVEPEPLQTEDHTWSAVGDDLRSELDERKPTYETVMADAKRRKRQLGADDALKSLSTLVEANPRRAVVARDVGFTSMGWGHYGHAYQLFQKVAHDRPYEPQTYHQAALTLDEAGKPNLALAYFELALSGDWDARFGSFRKIVRFDYLRFLRSTPREAFSDAGRTLADQRTERLGDSVGIEKADLVVTITWNTDATDVDLHVVEPSGEEVYYGHQSSNSTGARLTEDVIEGFGPEMYVLEDAPSGEYEVFANYYSDNRNRAGTRTKVYATVYRNWGSEDEEVTRKTVELQTQKEDTDIATLQID